MEDTTCSPGELLPYALRLAFDPLNSIHDNDGAVNDTRSALNLHRKVDMAGGVDDVDRMACPLDGD